MYLIVATYANKKYIFIGFTFKANTPKKSMNNANVVGKLLLMGALLEFFCSNAV